MNGLRSMHLNPFVSLWKGRNYEIIKHRRQAVLEGIMMKTARTMRLQCESLTKRLNQKDEYRSFIKWEKLTKIPFIRGIF